jgi:hypothetical protein
MATAIAATVAAALLAAVVVPAEYGVDPLGTGKLLGLDVMTAPPPQAEPEPMPAGEVRLVPTQDGPVATYPAEFKVDSRTLTLGPYEFIEFKYYLEKDATMLFAWKADRELLNDFHGEREGEKADPQSYDDLVKQHDEGSFAAPFTGIHGWYWENPGGSPVTIRLTTAGFYTAAREFHMDRTKRTIAVGGLDRIVGDTSAKESSQ